VTLFVFLIACGDAATPVDAGSTDASSDATFDAPIGDASSGDAGPAIRACSIRIRADGMVDDSCDGDLICICPDDAPECTETGRCNVAFGLRYLVGIPSADYPRTRASGVPWDADGAPDPYVRLLVDGMPAGMTPVLTNTTGPRWMPPAAFYVTAELDTEFRLEAWDADAPADELAFACGRAVTSAYVLRRRVLSCSDALGTIGAAILPMPE
jgi:hypothetical protein